MQGLDIGYAKGGVMATNSRDHTGVRYGRIVGVSPTSKRKATYIVWLWRCDCGVEFEESATHFVSRGSSGCPECSKKNVATLSLPISLVNRITKL